MKECKFYSQCKETCKIYHLKIVNEQDNKLRSIDICYPEDVYNENQKVLYLIHMDDNIKGE